MSQVSARSDAKSHSARDHWLAEQVFDWSGLNVAHIRPTYFTSTHGHTIRIAPPLVITSDQVDWALEGIGATLRHDFS
jgi:4-aminobutyrate aminotransferase-like enzyme